MIGRRLSPVGGMSVSTHNPTRVALDELIALSAVAHGASLARSRRSPALRSGGHASRWRGRGVDFRESRIYLPGDEIRHMDWRVTARSGTPHTKVFQEEREQGLLLVDGSESRHALRHARALQERAGRARGGAARVDGIGRGRSHRRARIRRRHQRRGQTGRAAVAACCTYCARCATGTRRPIPRARIRLSSGLARVRRLLRPGMRMVLMTDGFSADAESVATAAAIAPDAMRSR